MDEPPEGGEVFRLFGPKRPDPSTGEVVEVTFRVTRCPDGDSYTNIRWDPPDASPFEISEDMVLAAQHMQAAHCGDVPAVALATVLLLPAGVSDDGTLLWRFQQYWWQIELGTDPGPHKQALWDRDRRQLHAALLEEAAELSRNEPTDTPFAPDEPRGLHLELVPTTSDD